MLVVHPAREREFLHPIPVEDMWGVGASTAEKLHRLGLRTVGDLAACPEGSLTTVLGNAVGHHLHALANLREHRPVRSLRRRGLTLVGVSVAGLEHPGVGVQLELDLDRAAADGLDEALYELRDRYGANAVSRGTKLGRTVFSEKPKRTQVRPDTFCSQPSSKEPR